MARKLPSQIEAGSLRHRVQIVKPTAGQQDSMGGVSPDNRSQWTVILTCWASVEAWTGSATLAANQFISSASHWIVIRHPRTFVPTSQMKVWFRDFTGKDHTFQIEAVLNPTEQNKLLVLVCTEIDDSAAANG